MRSPNFSTLRHAWKGSCSSEPCWPTHKRYRHTHEERVAIFTKKYIGRFIQIFLCRLDVLRSFSLSPAPFLMFSKSARDQGCLDARHLPLKAGVVSTKSTNSQSRIGQHKVRVKKRGRKNVAVVTKNELNDNKNVSSQQTEKKQTRH